MNNEQQELLNDAFKRLLNETIKVEPLEAKERLINQLLNNKESQEEFINKCKTDPEFSEKWGLKIEERELSLEERSKIWNETHNPAGNIYTHNQYNENNLPTKLITITRELSEEAIWDYIHKNKIEILHEHAVLYGHEVGSEYRKSFIPTLKENYNIPTNKTIESYDRNR